MPKGFMVFVEDSAPPTMVHRDIGSAYREMYRLAALHPEKEVMLFQIHKRVVSDGAEGKAKSLGSHMPVGEKMVRRERLVTHDLLPVEQQKKKKRAA